MTLADLTTWQWIAGIVAAVFIGASKTGVPGLGMVSIPLLAFVFGSRVSLGAMLILLIAADILAVSWFRRHARWDHLLKLAGWVLAGIAAGAIGLWLIGAEGLKRDWMSFVIGLLIMALVAVTVLKKRLGDRFSPTSRVGVALMGASAGFATAVSNAAGPITSIYLTAAELSKEEFIGTSAWFYFSFNLIKVPVFAALTAVLPKAPVVTRTSLLFDLAMLLPVFAGAYVGKRFLSKVPQSKFEVLVLVLATIGGINLLMKL